MLLQFVRLSEIIRVQHEPFDTIALLERVEGPLGAMIGNPVETLPSKGPSVDALAELG